jgi:hypothetical protein
MITNINDPEIPGNIIADEAIIPQTSIYNKLISSELFTEIEESIEDKIIVAKAEIILI